MRDDPIGVFDSGVGGLNVLAECERILPSESFIYLADSANMPYGNKSRDDIVCAALFCAERIFSLGCKALVIACNTATTCAAADIRRLYPGKITVGLEPAVKPCLRELGRNGYAVALVTAATCASDKFNRLVEGCEKKIIPVACRELAALIERDRDDRTEAERYVNKMLAPYADAEAVVLGCSHYSYITGAIKRFYGGRIKIYDGATGAAERLKYCLTISDLLADGSKKAPTRFISTVRKGSAD